MQASYMFNLAIRGFLVLVAASTLSNAFVVFKPKPTSPLNNENTDSSRQKRDADTLNASANSGTLSSSMSTGSLTVSQSQSTLQTMQDNTENLCMPLSEAINHESAVPVDSSDLADTRESHYVVTRYHSYDLETRQCPAELLDTSGQYSVNHNSLCPWTYVTDEDNSR